MRGKFMINKIKQIPKFKNESDERLFWATADSTHYVDWSKAKRAVVFPNLKLSTKTISLRLPENLLNEMKRKANSLDIPYQSYIKVVLNNEFMLRDK